MGWIALLLSGIIVYLWRKNKSLEKSLDNWIELVKSIQREQSKTDSVFPTKKSELSSHIGNDSSPVMEPSIEGSIQTSQQQTSFHAQQSEPPKSKEQEEKEFQEAFGVLPCNGIKCNPNEPCNLIERLMCRNVITRLNFKNAQWLGQYSLRLPDGWRRIDFVIQLPDRALAIEVDGFSYHAQLKKKAFKDQLRRQNDLIMKNWLVLRFTFDDIVKNDGEACINVIKSAIYSKNLENNVRVPMPLLFADVAKPNDEDTDKKLSLFSDTRKRYYTVCADTGAFFCYDYASPRFWIPCVNSSCRDIAWRIDGQNGPFYKCNSCGKKRDENQLKSSPLHLQDSASNIQSQKFAGYLP